MRKEESRTQSNILEAASAQKLGKRIRELRNQLGWSLEELAERSDVSRAMLSKVERGENNPTLIVALKIATGLGVTTSQLIGIEERHKVIKVPKSKRMTFRDPETNFVYQIFPAFEGGAIEFVRHILPVGVSSGELDAHSVGIEKYLLMEQGQLRVMIGSQEYTLEEGDLFYFQADVVHRFDNIGSEECSYFLIKNAKPGF